MELSNPKTKIIKDNVHGYIKLEDPFWKIINTPEFQRLKWIEQSTISVLYPSAKHDRFAHSLGTFHLGQMAFDGFYENTAADIMDIINNNKTIVSKWRNSFLLACLLHDIGHVPFSHTCESLFKRDMLDESLIKAIETKCHSGLSYITDAEIKSFIDDYRAIRSLKNSNIAFSSPQNHEVLSAIITILNYDTYIKCFECVCADSPKNYPSLDLVIRSILGCVYQIKSIPPNIKVKKENNINNIKNCLIQLLNSKTLDVDKLDYINRDGQMSGYDNAGLDNFRLLSSLSFIEQKDGYYFPAFKKSALNVVYTVLSARDAQVKWIINHPIVVYDNFLLKKGVCLAVNYLTNKGRENYDEITSFYQNVSVDYSNSNLESASLSCKEIGSNYNTTRLNIFSLDALSPDGKLIDTNFDKNYHIKLLSETEIMSLIKQVPIQYDVDGTIEQIIDRSKRKKPIWKSNAEFVHYVDKFVKKYANEYAEEYERRNKKKYSVDESEIRKNIIQALRDLANKKPECDSLEFSIPEELLSSEIKLNFIQPEKISEENSYQHIINFLFLFSKMYKDAYGDDNVFVILKGDNSKINDKKIYKYTFIRFGDKDDFISYYDLDNKLSLDYWKGKKDNDSPDSPNITANGDPNSPDSPNITANDDSDKAKEFVYIYSKNKIETDSFLASLVYYFVSGYTSIDDLRFPSPSL